MKKKTQGLNDGYISIYTQKDNKTDFSAAITPKNLEDMDKCVDLAYKEQYKRQQDYEFAESSGNTLSLKVRSLLYEEVSTKHKAVIGNTVYSIFKIDHEKEDRVMYLFLEEERKLERE